ncbi:MAG: hypothetical protein GTO45_20040 [Candidatus Aminicenantes bacterium]|nr:hypothetical protein [Candidatus Aminicenantes bacterium]NIM81084.1 hypothetical protein [Candidatus Aminicenantes bacterium]NIN20461.1 hypothetical protein [Candidatus Aminicenantes bacterium]NIN44234.1 hypothetical protein [Candidatus Aminicenantes bacterium]NIN87053.1 hypothetical protein [Candidatus Aminicenantes bacterium]
MKTKNFTKKLTLNKKTIVHLNNEEIKNAFAGVEDNELCAIRETYGGGSCVTVCYTQNSDKSVIICCAAWYCM